MKILPWILVICFFIFFILSWILVFRDPRAMIGISNLYPSLKTLLFSTQETISHYGLNSIPTIVFAFTTLISFVVYFLSLRLKISLKKTILFAVSFQVIMFFSYPVLSTDIFSYIFSERVATVHHQNIWNVKPATFPDDQFGVLADWKDTTSVYGGMHYYLYLVPSLIGQNNLLLLVILYKLIPVLFSLGTMYIVYLLLEEQDNFKELGMRLVFWNPLFVLEIAGSGHNDSMMIFFTLLGYYFYRRKLWLLAGVILALAVQVKLIPIVLFFFCLVSLLRKKSIMSSGLFFAGFLSINALLFSFMQVSPLNFMQRVLYNGGVYWQSLPNVMQSFFPYGTKIISIIFLLWLIYFVIQQWRKQLDPLLCYSIVMLGYLLFVSAAYWNWYILWVLPLLPLITNKKILLVTLVFSVTSLFAYPLLWVIQRINNHAAYWPIVTYICIFAPPIVVYILSKMRPQLLVQTMKRFRLDVLIAQKVHN
jgi:hypothetical protein